MSESVEIIHGLPSFPLKIDQNKHFLLLICDKIELKYVKNLCKKIYDTEKLTVNYPSWTFD